MGIIDKLTRNPAMKKAVARAQDPKFQAEVKEKGREALAKRKHGGSSRRAHRLDD